MRSAEFWQRLLSAELAPAKNRVLLEELGSFALDPIDRVARHPIFSDVERKRLESADMSALAKAQANGLGILEFDDYPEILQESGNVPPALFFKGDVSCLFGPTVAIVGTCQSWGNRHQRRGAWNRCRCSQRCSRCRWQNGCCFGDRCRNRLSGCTSQPFPADFKFRVPR